MVTVRDALGRYMDQQDLARGLVERHRPLAQEGPRMKYQVMSGFCLQPHGDLLPGAVVELTEQEARAHVAIGRLKAAPATDPEPEVKAGQAGFPEGEPAAPQNMDPKPNRRRTAAGTGGKE